MMTFRVELLFLVALCGCSTTKLAESWVDPSAKSLEFRKVFVAFVSEDASAQRVAEDELAAHVHAPEVARCYDLFPDARSQGAERVKAKLREQGFDAAIVMRVSRVEQQMSWTEGDYPPHYRTFGGYWDYEPGALRTDEIVHVETNVYSLLQDKLLYAVRSETFSPGSTAGMVDEIAVEVADDLVEKGVLRPGHAEPR